MTLERERYVATKVVERWLSDGYTAGQIALMWNGGTPTIKSGVNKWGVSYDTGAYMHKVLAYLN